MLLLSIPPHLGHGFVHENQTGSLSAPQYKIVVLLGSGLVTRNTYKFSKAAEFWHACDIV